MIDESFIQAAIKIRRNYLKIQTNMSFYKKKASEVVDNLEVIIGDIQNLQESAQNREIKSVEEALNELTKILNNAEEEGKKLEQYIDPLNKEIEKLGEEEAELWRNIKLKYSNIDEESIVNYVKERLIKENLS
jgi:septal ring factor EnvC (AmiA/AmiB activator)